VKRGLGVRGRLWTVYSCFFAAGAPRVVASLWSVDDEATSELVKTLLEFSAGGSYANYAGALQAAMLTIRERYPDPYYWAGRTLQMVLGTIADMAPD
jgi:CHAT domain-containing protein